MAVRHKIFIVTAATLAVLAFSLARPKAADAQTIIDEWANVKPPPAPELKPASADPKTTALLMLDFLKQNCGVRPRCVASVPRVKTLLDAARAAKATVIYSFFGAAKANDIIDPGLAPEAGDASVTSSANKFLNTDLERMLKDKGIQTVITVGSAANGAVLYTASSAALRGFKVIVPVDGISSDDLYTEQFTAWQLANGPAFADLVTLTTTDRIKF